MFCFRLHFISARRFATPSGAKSLSPPAPPKSPAPSGRHIFVFGERTPPACRFRRRAENLVQPKLKLKCSLHRSGVTPERARGTRALPESQRDSNPSAQGWWSAPAGEERLPWETVPTNSPTLKASHQIRRRPDATPSELFSFYPFTQRSPTASVNAGLNDSTPLELQLPIHLSALVIRAGQVLAAFDFKVLNR
jgi:hypothetical protein